MEHKDLMEQPLAAAKVGVGGGIAIAIGSCSSGMASQRPCRRGPIATAIPTPTPKSSKHSLIRDDSSTEKTIGCSCHVYSKMRPRRTWTKG